MATFKLKVDKISVLTKSAAHLFKEGAEIEFEVDSDKVLDIIGEERCAEYFNLLPSWEMIDE